jgi:hypothetical protein
MIKVISSLFEDLQENILIFLFRKNFLLILALSVWDRNTKENNQKQVV